MKYRVILCIALVLNVFAVYAQKRDTAHVAAIIREATENSQLKQLAHELMDQIGPRLVGTPEMKEAHDWAVARYKGWGIEARNEKWGEWKGWKRGITHIDMIAPRVKSLEGTQLAWSGSTGSKGVEGETIILADTPDSLSFRRWLPSVKGKFVMLSAMQPTGRPEYNWDEFGKKASIENMKKEKADVTAAWRKRISNTGLSNRELAQALESAGAAGIVGSNWSSGFGVNKIFGAQTFKIPTIDLALEDYGLVYRLTESGKKPKLRVRAESESMGKVPTFNTIAEIKGSKYPDQYVVLSAHFDSWDGGTGATDNGTGTILMMEVMRILKKLYPNPSRTIIAGHWGSEEQGLNGSRAFVQDNPKIVEGIQAVFNQDNGTGRVTNINGQGFLHSYEYLGRWLSSVPNMYKEGLETKFPGSPGGGGSDHASFVAAGVPAFMLSSLSWSYGNYTWHTNRDTYDKIVFDDVLNNVVLTAILAYEASEDPNQASRDKMVLPPNRRGEPGTWPAVRQPNRDGGN